MRRMWVRLALAFTTVLLVVTILPSAILFLLPKLGIMDPFVPPDPTLRLPDAMLIDAPNIEGAVFAGSSQVYVFNLPLWQFMLIAAAGSLLLGLVAGIWVSRSFSRPVGRLVEAVHGIGTSDLRQRVNVRGSQELVELGGEINRMAANLESVDTTRRNLMADVAHELRTPLTVLEGNLQALLDGIYEHSEQEISRLFVQTHHLIRLVEDLRELALAETNQIPVLLQSTNLAELVQETVAQFNSSAEGKAVSLEVTTDRKDVVMQVDHTRIRQVLHNLLSNSLRHTQPGGHIWVGVCNSEGENLVTVSDDGDGIEQEDLPHILGRFHRVEASRRQDTGHSGLGLAIAKAFVEAHGGRIEVHSSGLGHGSTFTVHLPIVPTLEA